MADKKVNWALVGLGDIAKKRVGPAICSQPDSTLFACVTRRAESKRDIIESFRPRMIYNDVHEMLGDSNVDAVYLATPVFLHAPQAIAAMKAGKDVLVEKPMALNATEASRMCQVAQETGRRLAVAYYRRFWPRFQIVKDMVAQGEFGQVVLVRLAFHSWYRPEPGDSKAWRAALDRSGGGVLSDIGSHRLDLLAWWFGVPAQLVARADTLTHDYDVEDAVSMIMTLANGAHCTASFNWNSETWTDEIHVVGTQAKVTLAPCDGDEAIVTVGRDTKRQTIPKPDNAHYPIVDDFARAIIENRPPRFTGADGSMSSRIMDAVYRSSRDGTWVKMD